MLNITTARRQCLECDTPAQVRVFRNVDDAHAALAELFNDSIVRDGAADHGVKSKRILFERRMLTNAG
jgi:hypothetical protein